MVGKLEIDGSTRLMPIIGDPIAQAKTPAAINAIFSKRGSNIACVPLHVPVQELGTVWAGLKGMSNIVGFSITIPHKTAAISLCDSLDPLVERVGAVNVVRRERDGSFRGYQFDGKGFVRGLQLKKIEIANRTALIVGAGGAAVAIAFALVEAGVKSITISNRTTAKAQLIVDTVNADFGMPIAKVGPPQPAPNQLVINATSLGLNDYDALPLDPDLLHSGMTMAEVIAQPEITALLSAAADRGVEVHSGIHMIGGQVGLIAEHMAEIWS